MVSVTMAAVEIHDAAQKDVQKIARENNLPCSIKIPLLYKRFLGGEWELSSRKSNTHDSVKKLKVTIEDSAVDRGKYGFMKEHQLARFLIESLDWPDNIAPSSVNLKIRPTRTGSIKSTGISKISRRKLGSKGETDLLRYNGSSYDTSTLNLYMPFVNIGAIDTVFHLYKGREPRLTDFLPTNIINAYGDNVNLDDVHADIMEVPEAPEWSQDIDVELKDQGIEIPYDEVLELVQTHRQSVLKRHKETMRMIKSATGSIPGDVSCSTEESSFWKHNGVKFTGRVKDSGTFPLIGLIWPTLLEPARISFNEELPLKEIGYHIDGVFSPKTKNINGVDIGTYLNARSIFDVIGESNIGSYLYVKNGNFKIYSDEIIGSSLRKGGIRKMFDLAEKVSYVA